MPGVEGLGLPDSLPTDLHVHNSAPVLGTGLGAETFKTTSVHASSGSAFSISRGRVQNAKGLNETMVLRLPN